MKRLTAGTLGLTAVLLSAALPAGLAVAEPPGPATAEEIKALLAEAGNAEEYGNAPVLYVLDEADVYVQHSGLATTEACQVIKILTEAGIRSQSVIEHEFDPDTNRVAIRSVKVHRADGSIEEVDVADTITQPTRQWLMFWGGEQHLLSIPRLTVGDAVEIRTSKIGFNIAYLTDGATALDPTGLEPPMEGQWYEVTDFQRGEPIMKKRYAVHMPADMPIQYEIYNGELKSSLWFEGDTHIYTFGDENIPAFKGEGHMVARSDVAPKLVMATLGNWEAKSRWFQEVNEPQFEADDAIRAKVEEITEGLESEEAKIEACLHWVSDNIRYYGTSRGPREGFTLHRGIETFRDRGGVCKDIAGMLITMLRVLGEETYPTLTMAGSRVERIPADQFNHTVCAIRTEDGSFRILDPTWCPLSRELWSSREALQGIVYGTPEGQDLTLSPYFPPEYNRLEARGKTTISADGALRTDLRFDVAGYPGTYLRRYLDREPVYALRGMFEQYINIAPNAELEEFDHIEPADYSRDGWLEMRVFAAHYASAGDGRCLFKLPLMHHPLSRIFIPDLLYDFSDGEREYPLRLRATRLVRYEETIALPPGWKVAEAPEARSFDSPSASLDFEIIPGEGELTYRFEFVLKDHIVPAENYEGFKKAIDMMHEIADAWVLCTKQ
jgi:transglutaminase-like putative cysteine protease